MFIQDSRRSYRTYTYTDLCLLRTLVGVTELILILRNISLYFRSYTKIILVFRNTEVPVGTVEHFAGTKVPVGTTGHIHYTEVPVGTTGLILILRIREYS